LLSSASPVIGEVLGRYRGDIGRYLQRPPRHRRGDVPRVRVRVGGRVGAGDVPRVRVRVGGRVGAGVRAGIRVGVGVGVRVRLRLRLRLRVTVG
jgi:hypothetical protein